MREIRLTAEGFKMFEEELSNIKEVKLPAAKERHNNAESHGDAFEAEDAKEECKFYDKRIIYLENALKTAVRI